jgi:hypothetical protein
MGTKLQYEQMLKSQFPDLYCLQVSSSGDYLVTVYACDDSWGLPSNLKDQMDNYLKTKGAASFRFNVKPFFDLKADNIPLNITLPIVIERLALAGNISFAGIQAALGSTFKDLDPNILDVKGNEISVRLKPNHPMNDIQIEVIKRYLSEIMPFTARIKLTQ